MILGALPFGTLDFFIPLYVQTVSASPTLIGVTVGAGSAMVLLIRPLAGWLIDQGRYQLVLRGAVLALLAGLLAWSSAVAWPQVLLGRLGLAAGINGLVLAAHVFVAARRGSYGSEYGQITAATAIGNAIGAVLAAILLVLFDPEIQTELAAQLGAYTPSLPAPLGRLSTFHLIYGVYAGAAALALLYTWRLPQPVRQVQKQRLWRVWQGLLQRQAIRQLVLVGLLIQVAYSLAVPMIIPLLQERYRAGLGGLAIAYLIPGLIYTFAPGPLGRLADRLGHRRAGRLGIAISASVYVLLPLLAALPLAAVIWSVEALAYSLYVPALLALLARHAPEQEYGASFSLYSVVAASGAVVAAPLGGWLYEHAAPALPFLLAALAFVGASALLRGWKPMSQSANYDQPLDQQPTDRAGSDSDPPFPFGHGEVRWETRKGTPLRIRHIRPSDTPLLVDFFYHLSERTLSLRFATVMINVPLERVIEEASRLATLNFYTADALVALEETALGSAIVGVARLAGISATSGEFAMTIRDDFQGHGVGSYLFDLLLQIALARGLETLTASVLAENRPMLALIRKSGLPFDIQTSHGESDVTIFLTSAAEQQAQAD